MKHLVVILLVLLTISSNAQQRFPSGFPTQFNTGWNRWGYAMSDSGTIIANRDTTWLPKFSGTIVFRPGNKQFYWFDSTALVWNVFGTNIDTTSLSNRINLKLNISDTSTMLLPYLRKADTTNKWVQDIYVRSDSLFKFKNGIETFLDTLGGGSPGSGLTSVGLSLPSAFTVTNSPLTSNGVLNVVAAGTALQHIRGNGTLATTDTGMIPNFYLKVRGLLSGTSPITFNQTTGLIGINNANTTGTKGAASFTSAFSDNGSGLIDLANIVSTGGCTNCTVTFDAKGRATAFSSGIAPTGSSVDTIFRTPGVDSIYYTINSTQYAIKDSIGSGGGAGSDVAINVFKDTSFVPLIVFFGESNAEGISPDSCATAGELATNSKVQIMQKNGQFESMHIAAGNNNFTIWPDLHGWELELGNLVATKFQNKTVYLVKAGKSGSKIEDWMPYGNGNYDTLLARLNNALIRINALGKIPVICAWYSQGINDAINNTNSRHWMDSTLILFRNVRENFGFFPIIMTQLIGDRTTYHDLDSIDNRIIDLSANKNNYIYRVETPQASAGNSCTDSLLVDGIHWKYLGLKAIADRMTNVMVDTAGYYYDHEGIKNVTENTWRLGGNWNTNASVNFIGTKDFSDVVIRARNLDAIHVNQSTLNVGIGVSNPTQKLEVNGESLINGLTVGRGSGNSASNTAVGASALGANTTGSNSVAIGSFALSTQTTTFGNVAIGDGALQADQTACCNVAIGFQAGYSSLGSGNVFLGSQAGGGGDYSNKLFVSNAGSTNLLYGDFSNGHLVVNPGATPADDGVGTIQVHGKITVYNHTVGSNSDSAVIWDRSTNEYKYAKINGGGSATTIYNGDDTLDADRNVSSGGFTLRFAGANNSDTLVTMVNSGTSSIGAFVYGTSKAMDVQSTNVGMTVFGTTQGMQVRSTTDEAIFAQSDGTRAGKFVTGSTVTNTVSEVLSLQRVVTTGVGANGIGSALTFTAENTSGTQITTAQFVGKLTTATNGAETSQLGIVGVNVGSTVTLMTLDGNGNATFGTTNSIVGTATNNSAVAGNIGEEINSTVSTYTNYSTTATYQNITSITLTAGDWDLSAFFTYSANSSTITAASNAIFAISTTTASASGATEGLNINYVPQAALLGTSKFSDAIPSYRVSLSGTTTYYLNTQASFTVGNPQFVGSLRARRCR